jgi:integrase/recombinase XerD
MANTKVALQIRIRLSDGRRVYAAPAFAKNRKLKSLIASVNGKDEHHPEGVYVLRYRNGGRLTYKHVGSDPYKAEIELIRQQLELKSKAASDEVSTEPTQSQPEPIQTSVTKTNLRPMLACAATCLKETKAHKSKKTFAAYRETLELFAEALTGKSFEDIDWDSPSPEFVEALAGRHIEDITRKDVLSFKSFLEKRGNAPRTVRNRVDFFQIFLHHFGLPSLLKGKDLPKYTEKQVRAYNDLELEKMFGHATEEESDLLRFLLCTGVREQEAQFVCWSDVDLEARTHTITEHRDLGYIPKDKEEGSVPIPDFLVELLRKRRGRYPNTRLIFEGPDGKPNGHALRIVKRLALRAGVNCGHCVNKKGKSCAKYPVCRHVLLHKMRKTFATNLHRDGAPARTIMRLLRHSSLDTTIRYLTDQDDAHVREIANKAFSKFGGAA